MEAEKMALQPVMVRRIGPGAIARDSEEPSGRNRGWRRAAIVAAAGALFGFCASVWVETPVKTRSGTQVENSSLRQTSVIIVPAEPAPVKPALLTSAEVERLETRNRRLEALVQVLQKRTQTEKRNPDLKMKN